VKNIEICKFRFVVPEQSRNFLSLSLPTQV
jgi:hypothetical protein